jgi:biotin carboxyl carrier protein
MMLITADWPGRIAEIHVSVGDQVAAESEIITIESMKMLTPVSAPAAGRVAAIHVDVDEFVDEGASLLELETT